jgi:hypothetical protein
MSVTSKQRAEALDSYIRQNSDAFMITRRPVIAWDLDSTVRSTAHRRYLVPEIHAGRAEWADYAMLCADDTPIEGSVALMREMRGYSHIAVSGASDCSRELTAKWTRKHFVPLRGILMRPEGDHAPNGTWKVAALLALQRAGADIRLFFEDWVESARQVREETGIAVVGINPFDPVEASAFPPEQHVEPRPL